MGGNLITNSQMVLGSCVSGDTVHKPARSLLQAVRILDGRGGIGMNCYLDDLCYNKIEIDKNVTISYGV